MDVLLVNRKISFIYGSFIFFWKFHIRFGKLISKPFRPKKMLVKKSNDESTLIFKGCVNQVCPKT